MEYPQLMPIKKTRENVCCDLMLVGEYVKKQGWRMYYPLHLCSYAAGGSPAWRPETPIIAASHDIAVRGA